MDRLAKGVDEGLFETLNSLRELCEKLFVFSVVNLTTKAQRVFHRVHKERWNFSTKKQKSLSDYLERPISAPEGIRTPIDGTGNHNSIH